jgi:hypothetical protein
LHAARRGGPGVPREAVLLGAFERPSSLLAVAGGALFFLLGEREARAFTLRQRLFPVARHR